MAKKKKVKKEQPTWYSTQEDEKKKSKRFWDAIKKREKQLDKIISLLEDISLGE